jgi:hypothetical protein
MSFKTKVLAGAATLALVGSLAAAAYTDPCPAASSPHPRASSVSRRLRPLLDELSSLRSRLLVDNDLTASARTQLLALTDRIHGNVVRMLVRLRTALSKSSVLPRFLLSILAVYLCYGRREEPADYAFLPSCRYPRDRRGCLQR